MSSRTAQIAAPYRPPRRLPRPPLRAALAVAAAALLSALVGMALAAPAAPVRPASGQFAAAAHQPAAAAPEGLAPRAHGAWALAFRVDGRRLTALTVHSRLPCTDGRARDDTVEVALPRGLAMGPDGAFAVHSAALRVDGRFVASGRAIGTLTRRAGPCAVAQVGWTARRAG